MNDGVPRADTCRLSGTRGRPSNSTHARYFLLMVYMARELLMLMVHRSRYEAPILGSPLRRARPDGAEDSRHDGSAARIWDRAAHRADRGRDARPQPGNDLSGAPSIGAEGLDRERLGDE